MEDVGMRTRAEGDMARRSGFLGKTASLALLSLLALLSACQPQVPATYVLLLDEGWTAAGVDTFTSGLPATVPGTIHTDLLAAGLIPDPFWRDNELVLQWVGEKDRATRPPSRPGRRS